MGEVSFLVSWSTFHIVRRDEHSTAHGVHLILPDAQLVGVYRLFGLATATNQEDKDNYPSHRIFTPGREVEFWSSDCKELYSTWRVSPPTRSGCQVLSVRRDSGWRGR